MTAQHNPGRELLDLTEFITSCMQDAHEPGIALAIVKDGKVLLSQGYGKRNVAENLDITPQTLFAIASCTKAFTAMALAMLVDEKKLDWDTPLRHYLPSFNLFDSFASERLTPRDLLIHSSGLPDYTLSWYNAPISRKALVERLQYLEPTHDLRAAWQYNNMLYATAGYLLEVITGQTWEDFIRGRIFEPLGMTSATVSPSEGEAFPDSALPYTDRDRAFNGDIHPIDFCRREQAIGPAGAIYASTQDMGIWLQCLLNKGQYGENGARLVSETEFARMVTPQIVESDELLARYTEMTMRTYAPGWSVLSYRGHTMVQHGGLTDDFCSLVTLLPQSRPGIAIMTNLDTSVIHHPITYTLCDRLPGLSEIPWRERFTNLRAELIEQRQKSKQETRATGFPAAPLSHALSAYTGEFRHSGFGTFSLRLEDQRLKGTYNDLEYTFSHYHYDVFHGYEARHGFSCKFLFVSNLEGVIDRFSLTLEDPGSKPIIFTRLPTGHEA
ncbi:MAG TPA: serine hydrolase [Ktedonobacteraceae bacterium]